VVYGSRSGLSATGNQGWHQGLLNSGLEPGAEFGSALAAGDFDSDGAVDLAVGAPLRDIEGVRNGGEVSVIYGSSSRLTSGGNQRFDLRD
jgi:hypothetical protein